MDMVLLQKLIMVSYCRMFMLMIQMPYIFDGK